MAGKKQLGGYCGRKFLHLVESDSTKVSQIFSIPLTSEGGSSLKSDTSIREDLPLVSRIQSALREHHITPTTINISIPSTDIMFRTFVIPWMTPHEVKSVVEFEIKQVSPFSSCRLILFFSSHAYKQKR